MPEPDESSIRSIFTAAELLKSELESYPSSNAQDYQEKLQLAIEKLEQCRKLIEQASLFSLNESLEDLSTQNLRYMITDFNLAELVMKAKSDNRMSLLERSRKLYKHFLTLCDTYGIVSEADKPAVDAASTNASISSLPSDPAARRNAKIAQFKREKELKSKIEVSMHPMLLSQSRTADDEDVRSLYVASLTLAVMQTIQALDMISMEADILSKAPPPETMQHEQEEEDARRRARDKDGYSDKLDSISDTVKNKALLSKDGKPLRPFVLLDKRERLRDGVFRPGHNLPTMTIDEYLEEERRRGGIIEGGGESSGIKPEPNEDDYEEVDRETMKAREWDEFKEANPRGSGNTLNRG